MIITVASGKGGTGKTLVSTSIALAIGSCTYIDLDVEEPNGHFFLNPKIKQEISFSTLVPEIDTAKCTFCGKCAEICAFNALAIIPALKRTLFFPELCHSCGHCSYSCPVDGAINEVRREIGKIRIGDTENLRFIEGRINVGEVSGVPLIRGIVSDYIHDNELNIIDSSPGTTCPVVESMKNSDWVILVTEPTPFGLSDLKLTVDLTKDLNKKSVIVVNKDTNNNIIDPYAKKQNIPVALKIPYSLEVQRNYSQGISLLDTLPGIKIKFRKLVSGMVSKNEKNQRNCSR
jgi:MinD superfamily P-loop ATPase